MKIPNSNTHSIGVRNKVRYSVHGHYSGSINKSIRISPNDLPNIQDVRCWDNSLNIGVFAFPKLNFGQLEKNVVSLMRKDAVSSPHSLILEWVAWLACFVMFSRLEQLLELHHIHIALVLLDFHLPCFFCDFNTITYAMSKPCLHATKIWAVIYHAPSSYVIEGCKNMKCHNIFNINMITIMQH